MLNYHRHIGINQLLDNTDIESEVNELEPIYKIIDHILDINTFIVDNKMHNKYKKISKIRNIPLLIKKMHDYRDLLRDKIINLKYSNKIVKDLLYVLNFRCPLSINENLHEITRNMKPNNFNSIYSNINKHIVYMSLQVSDNFLLNIHTNEYKKTSSYLKLLSSAILAYYKFKSFELYITNLLKKKNIEIMISYKGFWFGAIHDQVLNYQKNKSDIINEIKNTEINDIYNNKLIMDFLLEIMYQVFPNYKDIESIELEKVNKIVKQYGFLCFDPSEITTNLISDIKKQKHIKEFNKKADIYKNLDLIKDNFNDPMKLFKKGNQNIEYVYYKLMFLNYNTSMSYNTLYQYCDDLFNIIHRRVAIYQSLLSFINVSYNMDEFNKIILLTFTDKLQKLDIMRVPKITNNVNTYNLLNLHNYFMLIYMFFIKQNNIYPINNINILNGSGLEYRITINNYKLNWHSNKNIKKLLDYIAIPEHIISDQYN